MDELSVFIAVADKALDYCKLIPRKAELCSFLYERVIFHGLREVRQRHRSEHIMACISVHRKCHPNISHRLITNGYDIAEG